MSPSFLRNGARATVVAAGVLALSLTGALAAGAHVSVSADTTAAGSYALLTFGVPHGCDGSSTTRIAIKIPDEINAVTPTVNPNWDVQKVMVPLDPPVTDGRDNGGNQLTERVDQIVYTARTPLPADLRDALVLSLRIPDVAGQALRFPVVQTCEVGETAWIEPEAAGGAEPDNPAPSIEVTAAVVDGHDGAASTGASTTGAPVSSAEVSATAASEPASSSNALAIAGLVAGLLGLLVGGIALVRSRHS